MNTFKSVCYLAIVLISLGSVRAAEVCSILNSKYQTLIRTGDAQGSSVAYGQLVDRNNRPIIKDGGAYISHQPDYTSFHKIGNELYVLSQTESPSPGGMFMMRVTQNSKTGHLSVVDGSVQAIDFSSVGGLWVPCGGVTTPWQSHIGGEEYEPDARALAEAQCVLKSQCGDKSWEALEPNVWDKCRDHLLFYGITVNNSTTLNQVRQVFNPYIYGHSVEVSPKKGGSYTVKKLMLFGRIARELSYIMPDDRTVYSTDDGDRVGFFKFVADSPRDFSSGTIYAAKMTQTTSKDGGNFDIEWIKMASGSQSEIENMVSDNISFYSIFDTAEPTEQGTCQSGFKSVNVGPAGLQCIKLKTGMEKAAAFLESRRYGAYLGGTVEFTKWEGITFSSKRNKMYTAVSEVRRSMEDYKSKGSESDSYDIGGPNHVRVEYNKCGCVYSMDVDSSYNIINMNSLVCGTPVSDDPDNACDIDGISNPDNLAIMEDQDQLIILEDTSNHQNDLSWAYDLNENTMTRIFSSPYGSEVTSGWWYPDINGWAYLFTIIQHPYEESDQDQANLAVNPYFDGVSGYLGYWAFPADKVEDADVAFQGISYPKTQKEKSEERGTESITACTTCENYEGPYYLESLSCPGSYLSVATKCNDTIVRLHKYYQAGKRSKYRRDFIINAAPNTYTSIQSKGRSQCSKNILASNRKPSFGTNSAWQYKIIPNGDCETVGLKAKSGDGKGAFLGVRSDCSGFYWRKYGSQANAQWRMIKQ